MENLSAYAILLSVCSIVVVSYLFSLFSKQTRIPSVLLLLGMGVGIRCLANAFHISVQIPSSTVELLGTIGLIMIVLEAGLDLEVTREKLSLIRSALRSASVVLLVSVLGVAGVLFWWIPGSGVISYIVYAVALSVISSTVIMSSVGHLPDKKREFLIYEAAFSDVLGIMIFNFFTGKPHFSMSAVGWFLGSIPVAIVLSIGVCFALMFVLVNSKVNVKFFLVFAVLIMVYVLGKMMALPSLITILAFGLVVNNWEVIQWRPLKTYFSDDAVNETAGFLKSITAESSFLIRTFFFLIFGFNIELEFLDDRSVWLLGTAIVGVLLGLRLIYLRVLNHYNLLPGIFYIPRGLITVLLFYKIPDWLRMPAFDEGVLFFVIIASSLIMLLGSFTGVHDEEP